MNAVELQREHDLHDLSAAELTSLVTEHPVRLVLSDAEGVHTVEYDENDDQLTFFANGSAGYDAACTEAVLELVAESDDVGIALADDPERTKDTAATAGGGA